MCLDRTQLSFKLMASAEPQRLSTPAGLPRRPKLRRLACASAAVDRAGRDEWLHLPGLRWSGWTARYHRTCGLGQSFTDFVGLGTTSSTGPTPSGAIDNEKAGAGALLVDRRDQSEPTLHSMSSQAVATLTPTGHADAVGAGWAVGAGFNV